MWIPARRRQTYVEQFQDALSMKRTDVEQIVTSRADDGLVASFAVQGPAYTLVH